MQARFVLKNRSLNSNGRNVFKLKETKLIHLNYNSILPETGGICYISNRRGATVSRISGSKINKILRQSEMYHEK